MGSVVTRRQAVGFVISAACPTPLHAAARAGATIDNGSMAAIVDLHADLRLLYDRGRWCEGPVWHDGGLVFSDVRANRIERLYDDGRVEPVRDPSRFANGNAVDREGRLISCEHLGRRIVRREHDGSLTTLADRFEGKPLNSPNDVIVAHDGAIWFTDPTFGLEVPEEGRQAQAEQRGQFLFRLSPSGDLTVAADSFEQPNGLTFSPDETLLYVSDTSASLNPEGTREIRVFDVQDGYRLARERIFAVMQSGIPDGLKTDQDGRLYAATEAGASVWNPDGSRVGRITTPGICGNLAFGGPDGRRLFLCDGPAIHAVDLKVRGASWRT